jgi:hypothetical protein
MSRYEVLSLLVAIVALAISTISLHRTRRLTERQLAFQEEQASLSRLQHKVLAKEQEEKQRADLHVQLVDDGNSRNFVFSNRGPAAARNVNFGFFGHKPVFPSQFSGLFPIATFRAGEEHSLSAVITLETPAILEGIFSWDDEAGRHHEQKCKITV